MIVEGYWRDIEWSEGIAPPDDPDDFALELGWVIVNSGMKYRVAKGVWYGNEARIGISDAIQNGLSASIAFGHKGKCAAIDHVWLDREKLLAEFLAQPGDEAKIEWLGALPWIGPITRYHAAKNFGVDCAKPDRHLARLAGRRDWEKAKITDLYSAVMAFCRPLAEATGDRIATVDMVLWRAAELGLINTRA